MKRRTTRALMWGGGALVAVVGVFLVWFVFLRGDAPPPVDLESAVSTLTTPTTPSTTALPAGTTATTSPAAPATTNAPPSTTTPTGTPGSLEGTWVLTADGSSFVGYRVEEELAGFGTNVAAGRTGNVTATLTVNGSSIESIGIEADMTSLVSDDRRRDRALGTRGLETNRFPTANFSATEPIEVPADLADGEPVATDITGDFTLHGVTRSVTAAVEAQLVGDQIVVVGSIPIALADYDIDPPTGLSVLSIDENGTAEFQLVLERG